MKIIKDNISIEVKMCNKFFSRFKGLMFTRNFDYSLCFPKCNSIHTFFMFKPIDVIMTDKDYNILYVYKNFKPYKIILPKKHIYYTFELPTDIFSFNINEKIKVE